MPSERQFDFERLDAFLVAVDAVAIIDALAGELPRPRGYITDQLRRAANSIVLNIAEGAGEFQPAEKARFYRMAKRSATECAGQLVVGRRLGLWEEARFEEGARALRRVIAMLVTLVKRCGDRAVARSERIEGRGVSGTGTG